MQKVVQDLNSGKKLRKYRQKLALQSNARNLKSILTLKFKLVPLPEVQLPDFNELASIYDTVEDIKKGSLQYLLFTLINSGFRIFSSSSEAKAFAAGDCYDDNSFYESLKNKSGLDLPDFVPSKIVTRLQKGVRGTNGKDNRFVPEVIASEYDRELGKHPKCEPEIEKKIKELFAKIGSCLASSFSGWNELTCNPDKALNLVDNVLFELYGNLPKIAEMAAQSESQLRDFPQNSAIAFDRNADFLLADETLNPYFAVASLLKAAFREKVTADEKYVKANLTTNTNNGLSWLYGNGLKLLKNSSLEEIANMFAVPKEKIEAVEQLKNAADAVKNNDLFVKEYKEYKVFRSSIGGHLDSWVTNYYKRLKELEKLIVSLPNDLAFPKGFVRNDDDFVNYAGCNRAEAEELLSVLCSYENRQVVLNSLKNLLGENINVVTKSDIETVKDFSLIVNSLCATKKQLDNALDQASEDHQSPFKDLKASISNEWKKWESLTTLPKINSLSGGVPDVGNELQKIQRKYYEITDAQRKHFAEVLQWIKNNNIPHDILKSEQQRQQSNLNKRKNTEGFDSEELAIRFILNKFGKLARQGRDFVCESIKQWFDSQNIFLEKKCFNKYFHNQLGSLYKSPFSKRNNNAYALSANVVSRKEELLSSLGVLLSVIENKSEVKNDIQSIRSLIEFRSLWFAVCLGGISTEIPSEIAKPKLDDDLFNECISPTLKYKLKSGSVNSGVLTSLFNCYKSLLTGYATVLSRNSFFLRTKFLWIKNNNIFYSPKDVEWSIPDTYFESFTWKNYKDNQIIVMSEQGKVDVKSTFEKIYEIFKGKDLSLRDSLYPLLRQLPHDWLYRLPFKNSDENQNIHLLHLSKDNKAPGFITCYTSKTNSFARLSGPSSYFGQLDEVMLNPNVFSVSDMTLLIDQEHEQKLIDGNITVSSRPYVMSLAVPISREAESSKETAKFSRILAIDQGEAGFAFAVFNLSDCGNPKAEPIATGVIPIPSIHRLIHSVKKYRGTKQRTQKFNQRFDSTMFTMRENVTGDVCGLIVALMQKYNAFPVLEYQVKNLESGSKQLQLVYKAVNSKFLRSSVDMQNDERISWWYQGTSWATGIYRLSQFQDEKAKNTVKGPDGKLYRELLLYPGTSVNASMTSRICHVCGRNAISLLRGDFEKGNKVYHVNENGEVTINGEVIKLYRRASQKTPVAVCNKRNGKPKTYASINERAPMTVPIEAGDIKGSELEKLIRMNMRRAPKSLMSKDTSQSRYFCVFKNCSCHNKEQHADVNAAINIGRRLLGECLKHKPE